MTNSLIPYTFTPGTKAKAQEVNANFIALADKIEENNTTALHNDSNATISGEMTFTKPLVSTGSYTGSKGNLTITGLDIGKVSDMITAVTSNNVRCASFRTVNMEGYSELILIVPKKNGSDIATLGIRNSENGSSYAFAPTYTTNYADTSNILVTTSYMANHWIQTVPTTTSTASKARPSVVSTNYLNGASGYIKFTDGLIMQWGPTPDKQVTYQTHTITFITPFSNTNYYVNVIRGGWNNDATRTDVGIVELTTTNCTIGINAGTNTNGRWLAIGY